MRRKEMEYIVMLGIAIKCEPLLLEIQGIFLSEQL